jgi:hypothetical protein
MNPEEIEHLMSKRKLPPGAPVLTVYLPIVPADSLQQGYEARLMDVLRGPRAGLQESERKTFEIEAGRLLEYVRDAAFRPDGRTLLLETSTPRDLFEAIPLHFDVPGLARFGTQPFFAPLDVALDDYPPVVVAVVDERDARLLLTVLGTSEFEGRIEDDVPPRQRQGGWAAFKYQRDREWHVRQHLQNVAKELDNLYARVPFKRLLIGATPETVSGLTAELSTQVKPLLAGSFRAESFAADSAIIEKALHLAEEAERKEEAALLAEVRDRASSGGNGAIGRDETLQCLAEGRVQTLLMAGGLLGEPDGDLALVQAWDTSAKIEVVRGAAEETLLSLGGLGALLRY